MKRSCCRKRALTAGLLGATLLSGARPARPLDEPVTPCPSDSEPLLTSSTLKPAALVRAVLCRNPGLAAARRGWQAALERIPQVTSLDDPMLSYGFAPLSVGAAAVRYGQVVQLAQHVPAGGTLRLRGEVARAEAEAARHGYGAARLGLATMARVLFADYYEVHRAAEIDEEHVALLEEFQRIATARYAAGTAAQQDPLQAEVELAHLLHQRVVLATKHRVVTAQINALLHRRPEAVLPPPPEALQLPPAPEDDAAALQEEAVRRRPELRGASSAVDARAAAVDLRERRFRPDLELRTAYNSMWGTGEHRWTVGVGVRLPLRRDRLRAGVAEAEALLSRARLERDRLEDEVRSEVEQALARLEEARHVVDLYRSRLLPAAHDQVEAALAGFRTGRNSFLAVIEAERSQRTSRLGLESALADTQRAAARLDRALGRLPAGAGTDETASESADRSEGGVR